MPSAPEKDTSDAEAVKAAQILLAMSSGTTDQEPRCDSPNCNNKTVGNANHQSGAVEYVRLDDHDNEDS
ncbi:hypothetical protein FGRMN_2536 [Fusarium graminum]|nr:hypothetical protein FGRMN_2536 [Fusarium graminum]